MANEGGEAALVVRLEARIAAFEQQMNKAVRASYGAASRIEKAFAASNDNIVRKTKGGSGFSKALTAGLDEVRGSLGQTAGSVPVLGAAFGALGILGTGVLAGLAVASNRALEAMEWGDALQTQADKLVVTAEALQEYQFIGDEVDVSNEALAKGFENLNASLGALKTGVGDAKIKKVLVALGLTKADLKGVSDASEFFPILADRIGKVGTTAEQVSLAKKLGIEDLLPMLRLGSDGLEELRDRAHELGLVLDNETVQSLADADRQMELAGQQIRTNLRAAFSGLAVDIAEATSNFAGFLTNLRNLRNDAPEAYEWITKITKAMSVLPGSGPGMSLINTLIGNTNKPLTASMGAIQARFGAPKANPDFKPVPEDQKGPTAADRRARGQQALDASLKAQLQAQMALTDNIVVLADLKEREIEVERHKANADLKADIAKGSIDKALAERAIIANDRAAADKKLQLAAETEWRLQQQWMVQQAEVGREIDTTATIQAGLAETIAARYEIERRLLAAQQKRERDELAANLAQEVGRGTRTQSQADARMAVTVERQAAERKELRKTTADEYKAGILDAFEAARGGAASLANYFVDTLKTKMLDKLADAFAGLLMNVAESKGGGVLKSLGKFAGFFATGGHVPAGKVGIAGENGPEPVFGPATVMSNAQTLRSLSGVGGARSASTGSAVVQQFFPNFSGAVMTEDLMQQFKAYADRTAGQAAMRGAQGGAAMARQQNQKSAANRLGVR